MKQRVEEKREEYGDSWKISAIGFLDARLTLNYQGWLNSMLGDAKIEQKKLVDLANMCMFLWKRLG